VDHTAKTEGVRTVDERTASDDALPAAPHAQPGRPSISIGLGPADLHLVLDDRRRSLRVVVATPGQPEAHLVLPAPRLAALLAALRDWPLDLLAELARAEVAFPPVPFPRPRDPRFTARARARELTVRDDPPRAVRLAAPRSPRLAPRAREAASIGEALERLADAVLAWRAGAARADPPMASPSFASAARAS
jgi:hypothetical protein